MSAISTQEVFRHGAFYSTWKTPEMYVVYSYGPHWPLAVWTTDEGWVLNSTKYTSPTTNRHAGNVARQLADENKSWLPVKALIDYIARGGPVAELIQQEFSFT